MSNWKEEINWSKGLFNGNIRMSQLFVTQYNYPPQEYHYKMDDILVDLEHTDFNRLREVFPDAIIKTCRVFSEEVTSEVEKREEIDEYFDKKAYVDRSFVPSYIELYMDECFINILNDQISIYSKEINPGELLKTLLEVLPRVKKEPNEQEIELVAFNNEFYTITSKINKVDVNIDTHYNDDFKEAHKKLIEFLDSRNSGLVILRGVYGSGKTTLIRNLINHNKHRYIYITPAIAERLASPEFISFMLDNRDSIYILEDCEAVIQKRSAAVFNGALANILNMTDGIMGDIFNIKFLITMNCDINDIDPALLRKGRCYLDYKFDKLCVEKSKALLESMGVKLDKYEPMTLADIYNYDVVNRVEPERRKIGF